MGILRTSASVRFNFAWTCNISTPILNAYSQDQMSPEHKAR